jgi:tetratricopeptide (TPR) repeat protein
MLARLLIGMVLAATAATLSACAGRAYLPAAGELVDEAALLGGTALFGVPVSAEELPDADPRGLDEQMRVFVARAVGNAGTAESRMRRLLSEMKLHGLLSLDYAAVDTGTAQETFYARTGNCLAFTNLFVALAREAGLQASYQQVDIPPHWTAEGEVLILNQHVNVRIRRDARQRDGSQDRIVDFNLPAFAGNYPQHPVPDRVIDALFYNNLAVAAMQADNPRAAFVYFLKALGEDPDAASVWTNLGVLYQRQQANAHAEAAFHRALRAEPGYPVAMSNLARLYAARGEQALAALYRERIRSHQQRNPYYHYHLASRALAREDTETALAAVNRAIRMRAQEHQFHFLRAQVLEHGGDIEAARQSLARAYEYATFPGIRSTYERKLEAFN